jgi:hypothetical protein
VALSAPLAIRLSTSRRDTHVEHEALDLSFRSVVPGGFASCTVSLARPLDVQPEEIAAYGRLYVYDTRNGSTVWEGRVEDPGRSAGDNGEIWELTAVGPSAHARDRRIPIVYVDRSHQGWQQHERPSTIPIQVGSGEDPGTEGQDALVLRWELGAQTALNARATAKYLYLAEFGQELALLDFKWDVGSLTTNFVVRGYSGPTENVREHTWDTAGGGFSPRMRGTHWTTAEHSPYLQARQIDTLVRTATEIYWASFHDIVVVATRYTKSGSHKTSGYTSADREVLASAVVEDLLGRLLNQYDGANATVTATTYPIEQLSYPDGVTPADILDDLIELEPAFHWAAWETTSAGKWRFEWKPWPTVVRYETDMQAGFDAAGSADGLYNEVWGRWQNVAGRTRMAHVSSTVPALDDAGLTRTQYIDLSDTTGSLANATQAANSLLAEHAKPSNSGSLTVTAPVLDVIDQRYVMPWEIRPGNLIRVRGVLPNADSLNASDRDGVTVFRIAATDYKQADNAVTLELDSYSLTVSNALASLRQSQQRRSRR